MHLRQKIILVGGILVIALFVASQMARRQSEVRELPRIATLPAFALTDQFGTAVSEADLSGRIVLVDFVFTHCQGPCPLLTERLGYFVNEFSGTRKFAAVSVTTDPERDTPDVLRAYAPNAPQGIWYFLTGAKSAIEKLMIEGFMIGTYADPAIHSTRLVLVDDKLTIRAYYEGTDTTQLKLIRNDIKRLLRESHRD